MKKKAVVWLTAAAIVLTVSGCGGNDKKAAKATATPTATETPAEETEAADTILSCGLSSKAEKN